MSSGCIVAPTLGEICRRLAASQQKVRYIIKSRDLRPISRAGNAWVYSDEQVEFIAAELRRINSERKDSLERWAIGSKDAAK